MTQQEFKSNFGGQDLPSEMQLLFDFQDKFGAESYVAGFGLLQNDKNILRYYGWYNNEHILKALMPFAEGGEGSIYCLWDDGTNQPLNFMPIIYFDSEGEGETIIARNFLEFIQVLMIPDPYDDWRPQEYVNFIFVFNETLKLEIPSNTDAIEIACKSYQESYDQWKNQYLNN